MIIVGVLVVLFGAKRLPAAARSLGRSARILKAEVKDMNTGADTSSDTAAGTATDTATAAAAALPPVQASAGAEASIASTNPVAAAPGAVTPTDRATTGAAVNGHPGR